MTDNEIIKALECCLSDNPPCYRCKYDADTITRTKAVKEFADRLKNLDVDTHYSYASIVYELSEDDIDNLVKEMVGESNA